MFTSGNSASPLSPVLPDWFPTYLYRAKGMSILKVGFVASIPAIAGFIGGLLGGVFSDWLLKRGYSLTVARKLPVICGMLLSCVIVIANYTSSEFVVIAAMSLAFLPKGLVTGLVRTQRHLAEGSSGYCRRCI